MAGDKGMAALTRSINELGEVFDVFSQTNDQRLADVKARLDALEGGGAPAGDVAALRERIEELEARAGSPGATGKPAATPRAWKVYNVGDEQVYELPARTRMADVIRPAKAAPVSLERWLAAAMLGEQCRDREAVQYARDIQAGLTTGTTGVQVPTEFVSQWIDNLRDLMVLSRAGISTVTMLEKTQTHSRVLTDPTAGWHAEEASITATTPTFELRSLVAKTLVARVQGSVELAQDSPDFGAQLLAVMGRALAAEIDRAGIRGTGGTQPQGVIGTSGVNAITGVGVLADYDKFVDALALLWGQNVPEERVGPFLISPPVAKKLRKLKTGISSDKTTLQPPPGLPPFLVSDTLDNHASPASSSAAVGLWADLVLGVRREASLEALRLTTYASNLQVEYVAYARLDFLVRRPVAFTTMTGIAHT
jgi:HK97 family phage major capsid protein